MPTVSLYPGGVSGGFAPTGIRRPGVRQQIKGWTASSARGNIRFLWSVNCDEIGDAPGWAVTLTLGTTPDNSDQWTSARNAFLERARRAGMTRYHWVTEWTAKGRPHLHAAIYGIERANYSLLPAWLDIADSYGWVVNASGQHMVRIDGVQGWLQYVAKHAARGVVHYQRDGAPEGWEKTGRLWGRGGDWPVEEAQQLELGEAQFVRFRELCWAWMLDDMRARGVPEEFIDQTAQRWANPEHGHAQGLSGWIPGPVCYAYYNQARAEVPHDFAWEN